MCLNCHVVTMDIEINSIEALERACQRLGWQFRRDQTTYQWVGRWYDDSPVPRHIFAREEDYANVVNMSHDQRVAYMETILGKCQHAIHIPGHDCEIGVVQVNGKWELVWDWASSLQRVITNPEIGDTRPSAGPLQQAYAVERTKLEAQKRGQHIDEYALEDGTVKLAIEVGDFQSW